MAVSPPIAAWLLAKNRRRRMAASLEISGTPVTTATVGVAYGGFTVSASGGQGGAYHFTVRSGALPAGITLDQWTGAVAGTPTEDGAFPVVISVTDAAGNVAILPSFTITVSP